MKKHKNNHAQTQDSRRESKRSLPAAVLLLIVVIIILLLSIIFYFISGAIGRFAGFRETNDTTGTGTSSGVGGILAPFFQSTATGSGGTNGNGGGTNTRIETRNSSTNSTNNSAVRESTTRIENNNNGGEPDQNSHNFINLDPDNVGVGDNTAQNLLDNVDGNGALRGTVNDVQDTINQPLPSGLKIDLGL